MDRDQILIDLPYIHDVLRLPVADVFKLHRRHQNAVLPWIIRFLGMGVRLTSARGSYVVGEGGRRYLDLIAGFGALNFGHEPLPILEAVQMTDGFPNLTHSFLNPASAKLAETLAKLTDGRLERCFFCNSGTEAVEAAMKLARASTGKKAVIYAQGAFHGKTMGSLSVSGREKYKKPFQPLVPETRSVPYGDSEALEAELKQGGVAAFIVEPVQGEGGIIVPPEGYLKEAETLCKQFGALLIVDEIQTGMGRTGKIFCYQHENVDPDVVVLSKSLSGGVMPIGAIVMRDELWKKAYGTMTSCLLHTSTFGGNTKACVAGLASIRLLLERNLDERAARLGKILFDELTRLKEKHPLVKEVRGKGLMIGLSFDHGFAEPRGMMEGALTLLIARRLFRRHGIITGFTLNNYNVLRIEPPLIIEEEDIRYFIQCFDEVLTFMKSDWRSHVLRRAAMLTPKG